MVRGFENAVLILKYIGGIVEDDLYGIKIIPNKERIIKKIQKYKFKKKLTEKNWIQRIIKNLM